MTAGKQSPEQPAASRVRSLKVEHERRWMDFIQAEIQTGFVMEQISRTEQSWGHHERAQKSLHYARRALDVARKSLERPHSSVMDSKVEQARQDVAKLERILHPYA